MGCLECFDFFGILKIHGFVFVKTNLILQLQLWWAMPTYFSELALTSTLDSTFYFLISPKWSKYLSYLCQRRHKNAKNAKMPPYFSPKL